MHRLSVEIVEGRKTPHGNASVAVGGHQESRIDRRPLDIEHGLVNKPKRLYNGEFGLKKRSLFVPYDVQ